MTQPMLGSVSNQCLSCHDGTVAVGATVAYGQVTTRGSMNSADVFGSNHAIFAPIQPCASLAGQHRPGCFAGCEWNDRRSNRSGEADQRQRGVHIVPQSARAGQGSGIAEFSGEGQLERPALPRLPRSQPDDGRPGQSAGRLVDQRARAFHKQDLSAGAARKLSDRGCRCVHLVPCAPQCERSDAVAARAE